MLKAYHRPSSSIIVFLSDSSVLNITYQTDDGAVSTGTINGYAISTSPPVYKFVVSFQGLSSKPVKWVVVHHPTTGEAEYFEYHSLPFLRD